MCISSEGATIERATGKDVQESRRSQLEKKIGLDVQLEVMEQLKPAMMSELQPGAVQPQDPDSWLQLWIYQGFAGKYRDVLKEEDVKEEVAHLLTVQDNVVFASEVHNLAPLIVAHLQEAKHTASRRMQRQEHPDEV